MLLLCLVSPAAAADPPASGTFHPGSSCLDSASLTQRVSGRQAGPYQDRRVPPDMTIVAAGATWETRARGSAVRVSGGEGICWHGGRILGHYSPDMSWAQFHDTYAFIGSGRSMIVENLRAHNFGDGIKWLGPETDGWAVRGIHLSHMHDDCVETDWAKTGRIEDALFEGCYVFLATRPRSSLADRVDGSNDTILVERAIVWMEPMKTVYSGPAPSTGSIFKVDNGTPSRSPRLRLRRMTVRVDMAPGVGDACLNPNSLVVESVDNVVVWLGAGDYPCLPLPAGWTLTRDRAVYDRAVARWKAEHRPG